jgi:peptide deformylase
MALRQVLTYPDPRLKEKAPLTPIADGVHGVDDETKKLIRDLVETMSFEKGIGLAATQVGAAKRVIVLDVPDIAAEDAEDGGRKDELEEEGYRRGLGLMALVNPVIVESSGTIKYEEGCLSVPGYTAEVKRAFKVLVEAVDEKGEAKTIKAYGLLAVALQHEIDHLDGVLFIDRLSRLKRDIIKRKLKKAVGAL